MALDRAERADARYGFVERFNGRMRDELLNEALFFTIGPAHSILARWRRRLGSGPIDVSVAI